MRVAPECTANSLVTRSRAVSDSWVAARYRAAAARSVVGVHGTGAQPLSTELPGSSMRADLLARTPDGIVHVEFVKDRSPNLDLRMVE